MLLWDTVGERGWVKRLRKEEKLWTAEKDSRILPRFPVISPVNNR